MNTTAPLTSASTEQEQLRREKAAMNTVVGKGEPTTVTKRFQGALTSVEEALNAAYAEAGVTAPPKPVHNRTWKNSVDKQTMEWHHVAFGNLQMEVQGFQFDTVTETDLATYAEVKCGKREPVWLSLVIMAKANEGVHLLHAAGTELSEVMGDTIPPLRVKVEWDRANGKLHIPHTREQHKDNIDIVFLKPDGVDGAFVQVEVSISSRGGRFYVAIQEVYCGQVGRTTKANAEKLGVKTLPIGQLSYLVTPLYPENAYPGADYMTNLGDTAVKVIGYAVEKGVTLPLHKCVLAEWNPPLPAAMALPEVMTNRGWKTAVVLWYNLVLGWGFVLCEDGKPCFAHMANIIDAEGRTVISKGEFPLLQPMRGVALKYAEDQASGKRKATAIRTL